MDTNIRTERAQALREAMMACRWANMAESHEKAFAELHKAFPDTESNEVILQAEAEWHRRVEGFVIGEIFGKHDEYRKELKDAGRIDS